MSCYNDDICKFKCHFRLPEQGNICVETKTTKNPLSIYLGRHNLSFLWFYQIGFIFRPGNLTKVKLHHKNGDKFDDTPGNIIALEEGFHIRFHHKIKKFKKRFLNYDVTTDHELIELERSKLNKMLDIDNDIIIMDMIKNTYSKILSQYSFGIELAEISIVDSLIEFHKQS